MRLKFIILSVLFLSKLSSQTAFKVEQKETETWRSIYSLVDEKNNLIKVLDSSKYYITFNINNYGYFAIFGKKGSPGWTAIDAKENILFQVYNTSFGEPSPDYLIENKIRIINGKNKIGFANEKGQIIIKPQFEIATAFHKGKAIIGESCDKIPWDEHAKEEDCHHYSIVCKKHGYINQNGEILQIGNFSFEEIQKKIKWKAPEL